MKIVVLVVVLSVLIPACVLGAGICKLGEKCFEEDRCKKKGNDCPNPEHCCVYDRCRNLLDEDYYCTHNYTEDFRNKSYQMVCPCRKDLLCINSNCKKIIEEESQTEATPEETDAPMAPETPEQTDSPTPETPESTPVPAEPTPELTDAPTQKPRDAATPEETDAPMTPETAEQTDSPTPETTESTPVPAEPTPEKTDAPTQELRDAATPEETDAPMTTETAEQTDSPTPETTESTPVPAEPTPEKTDAPTQAPTNSPEEESQKIENLQNQINKIDSNQEKSQEEKCKEIKKLINRILDETKQIETSLQKIMDDFKTKCLIPTYQEKIQKSSKSNAPGNPL